MYYIVIYILSQERFSFILQISFKQKLRPAVLSRVFYKKKTGEKHRSFAETVKPDVLCAERQCPPQQAGLIKHS
jgi:hypothetical protein